MQFLKGVTFSKPSAQHLGQSQSKPIPTPLAGLGYLEKHQIEPSQASK